MTSEVVSLSLRDAKTSTKGLVTFRRRIVNQKDQVVQEMTAGVYYLRKPGLS